MITGLAGSSAAPIRAGAAKATFTYITHRHDAQHRAEYPTDGGEAPGVAIEENEEIRRLRAENRRLREDVAILKAATTFVVGELDPRND